MITLIWTLVELSAHSYLYAFVNLLRELSHKRMIHLNTHSWTVETAEC